jgi:hypothetical protein
MLAKVAPAPLSSAAVTVRRKRIALAIAGMADLAQAGFFPIFGEGVLSIPDDVLDVAIAVLLLLTLGFRWRLALAFAIELIPGATLFPTWTATVLSMPTLPEEGTARAPTLPGVRDSRTPM